MPPYISSPSYDLTASLDHALDEAENLLLIKRNDEAADAAKKLLRKLSVVPVSIAQRFEPAATCVLIQAHCEQRRLHDAVHDLQHIYGDLTAAPVDTVLVLSSFLLEHGKVREADRLVSGRLRHGIDGWTPEQREIFGRFLCVELHCKAQKEPWRAAAALTAGGAGLDALEAEGRAVIAAEVLQHVDLQRATAAGASPRHLELYRRLESMVREGARMASGRGAGTTDGEGDVDRASPEFFCAYSLPSRLLCLSTIRISSAMKSYCAFLYMQVRRRPYRPPCRRIWSRDSGHRRTRPKASPRPSSGGLDPVRFSFLSICHASLRSASLL